MVTMQHYKLVSAALLGFSL